MNKNILKKLFVGGSLGVITLYSGTNLCNKYKLEKEYNSYPKMCVKKVSIVDDVFTSMNEEYLGNLPIFEEILKFVSVLSSEGDNINFTNLYRNLRNIKVELRSLNVDNFFSRNKDVGRYVPVYNTMIIEPSEDKSTIYHELFHVASCFLDKDGNIYSGFSQFTEKDFIGDGIDEGYTELLTRRYFDKDCNGEAYDFEVLVMSLVEEIIGKEKMEQLYFQSNLYGLILELRKYSTKSEILKFIHNVDFYNKFKLTKFNLLFNEKLIRTCLNDIASYLLKTYCAKQLLEYNEIDVDSIKEVSKKLMKALYYKDIEFYYFDKKDESRVINTVCREYALRKQLNNK